MTEVLHSVESCPEDADSWLKAGIRLNCPNNIIGRNLYQCAPNEDKTDLVEFCLKGSIGRYEEGLCIVAYPSRYIDAENCTTTFQHGCPEKSYTNNEIYNYPACLEINRAAGCYLADPTCPSIGRTPANLTGSSMSYQDGLRNVTSATTNVTNPLRSNPQVFVHGTAAVVSSLSVIGIVFGIILFLWCRKKACWKKKQGYGKKGRRGTMGYMDEDDVLLEEPLPLVSSLPLVFQIYAIRMDESKWKTLSSEKIGSLPAEQKCILYSLLAHDSWSDSEQWLSTLNDIRGTLFDAGSVSVKDTERDIKELKKMNFVQNNQISSTDYAEDVIYQLWESTNSKFRNNYSYMLTLLCVTLVRKYCGTSDQFFKGEKVINCGDGLSRSLVYRLQMDIIKHQTMEDWAVRCAASSILNLPEEILQSQQRRTDMYNDLRSRIDRGDVRKLGAASWTRMTRKDEEDEIVYELRPQCARSTIGQHDHNDIFIMQGDMYALKDEFQPVNGDIENLYTVLLSDKFSVPFDKRYIFGGITEKTGNVVRFVSNRVRHQVMHSYLVSKLLTDDAMRAFINEASADCLVEYGRLWRYRRKDGESCLFIPKDMEKLYIEKIGYAALKHVQILEQETPWKDIKEKYDIPSDLFIQSQDIRNRFVEYMNDERKRQGDHAQPLKYMYSAFLFNQDGCKSAERITESNWPILLTILTSSGYTIERPSNDISRPMSKVVEELLAISDIDFNESFNRIKSEKSVFKVKGKNITFASSEMKHAVMSKFVATCLKSDEGFKAYIGTSSPDSLMEYCRLWNYKRNVEEACVFLPPKFIDDYVSRLNIDVITHVLVEDREDSDGKNRSRDTRQKISKLLDIPLEVMSWDINSRRRYAERIKLEGKKEMFRARGMLVGCTGAGKTTLLRRLQRKPTSDTQQPTETTLGLEIHDHMFQINSGVLEDHEDRPTYFLGNKQLISMTDFAGQAAYYACHQVYLSRRAFYLLLIDMSKRLDEEAHEHNRERHDPVGSLFHHWSYKDYFTFWLQCIKTYCEVGDRGTPDDIERLDRQNPVILVASHKDECKSNEMTSNASHFFQELRRSLPKNQTLGHLLSPDRYLEVECPSGSLSPQQEDMIEDVRKCIVHTVENLYHWGEQIPLSWARFEDVLKEKKGRRILKRSMLKRLEQLKSLAKSDIDDMLRFFHEIGQILYFADEKLRDVIIIDVQWFVDGFKNIITDQKHFPPGNLDDDEMMKSGRITELTLKRIWDKEKEKHYFPYMADLLPYMEKLGLMVEIKTQKRQNAPGKTFYIPSMNTVDVRDVHFKTINAGQKTSILVFHFKTYLPHFFFFRLVVHCFKEWNALSQDMFCKNAAFFKDKDECIAIAVNKTSIQVQVFTRSQSISLKAKQVVKIRSKVERIIREITQTFHKQVTYEIGYPCKDIKITDEDEDDFLLEGEIPPVKRGISETKCPRHVKVDESHDINTQDMLRFWNK